MASLCPIGVWGACLAVPLLRASLFHSHSRPQSPSWELCRPSRAHDRARPKPHASSVVPPRVGLRERQCLSSRTLAQGPAMTADRPELPAEIAVLEGDTVGGLDRLLQCQSAGRRCCGVASRSVLSSASRKLSDEVPTGWTQLTGTGGALRRGRGTLTIAVPADTPLGVSSAYFVSDGEKSNEVTLEAVQQLCRASRACASVTQQSSVSAQAVAARGVIQAAPDSGG
jgi:hypothetical protein